MTPRHAVPAGSTGHPLRLALVLAASLTLLAACGGGQDSGTAEVPKADPLAAVPSSAGQTAQGAVDYQLALAKATSEVREPFDVNSVSLAQLDTAEPLAVD